jgi:hypothetical protein
VAGKKDKLRYGPTSYSTARYDSAEAAAAAASSIFNPMSIESDREVGGAIVLEKGTGKYYFSYTLGDPEAGKVNVAVMKRDEDQVLGIWHTHGNEGPARQFFSPDDYQIAKDHGIPVYMADHTGTLRKVEKGDKMVDRMMYKDKNGKWKSISNIAEGNPVADPQTGETIVLRTKREEHIVEPGQLKFPRIQ